ncbi:hypothetical protein FA15DRAFT_607770 [Coprinopsis marcescibilis]|uniref:Rad21/Rec8-like protein N-terminal domain-containing protein n=1 Tax=Coprinopsis marcescibilis TaxID=230819 RepID=A0A5C3LCA7_COPMA|nr:hypothetical protein FA15DRAFT_607770 [Coprinopsis marcescibilis]
MFFTPELLAKRDSGFGLLWLAATLGSKSAFKKLPRRSVITADITGLCDLISEPVEPLALRLSSNLMFGVVRCVPVPAIAQIKQDIFFADVSSCVTALKKVVQEGNSKDVDAKLQLAQSSVRPSAITIRPDSAAANVVDFDVFVTARHIPRTADWDEYLNIAVEGIAMECRRGREGEDEDVDFDPKATGRKSKSKPVLKPRASAQLPEYPRQDQHMLDEHHDHLLTSFDASFVGVLPGLGNSSSQAEAAFSFDQNPFDFSDGLVLGDGDDLVFGDELAREIGWASPVKGSVGLSSPGQGNDILMDLELPDFQFDADMGNPFGEEGGPDPFGITTPVTLSQTAASKAKESQNDHPRTPSAGNRQRAASLNLTPGAFFARDFLTQDLGIPEPLQDVTTQEKDRVNQEKEKSKPSKKRTRLLLDARTELTDDELKIARANYLQHQKSLRREVLMKQAEKYGSKLIDEYLWSAPKGIQDQGLIDFWNATFKVQVDAKSGALTPHEDPSERVPKRQKLATPPPMGENDEDYGHQGDMGFVEGEFDNPRYDFPETVHDRHRYGRSSEEPGQGRHASRPSSIFGGSNLGIELPGPGEQLGSNDSQRSSLFPWDNAGIASSSSGNVPFKEGEDLQFDPVDIQLSGGSKRRKTSVAGSQHGRGSTPRNSAFSPVPFRAVSPQQMDIDDEFNVQETQPEETPEETQKSEVNVAVLEKNSFNFLEYARMQSRALSHPNGRLSFDKVSPPEACTRHVAGAAFYHCLVLATKNLIRLEQAGPYETVFMTIL